MRATLVLVVALLVAAAGCGLEFDRDLIPRDGDCARDTDCDDGIECTHDVCEDATATCSSFGDNTLCGEDELCVPETGCIPRRPCVAAEDCQDQDPCNGEERCEDDACVPGTPLECDDGLECTGQESCVAGEGCVPGTPPACLDGIDCTTDRCDPVTDDCESVPVDAACDDGEFCNGAESCDPGLGCQAGALPCADEGDCGLAECVEAEALCLQRSDHTRCTPGELCLADGDSFSCEAVPCNTDPECDDGDPCNGEELCDEGGGLCEAAPGLDCDDGIFCDGAEYCDPAIGCQPQAPPACIDGVDCTVDSCDPGQDACQHVPSQVACQNELACDGSEVCGPLGCEAGPPPDCDDGSACTENACDEEAGGCTSTPRDQDGDGFGDAACGGTDCDDEDQFVSPAEGEVCNGVDDDCNLAVDDGFACRTGQEGSCTTACGSTGSRTCTAECDWDECSPPAEDCNRTDDDCDGDVDEGCGCSADDPTSCPTPCGSTGSRQCAGGQWTACEPPAEACNGLDDDCDETVDDGFACTAGVVEICATACGSSGTRTCSGSCTWGACAPPAESCNGADDDCDGTCDDGFACCANDPGGACLTACNSLGSTSCSAACTVPVGCAAPAETCNGRDDDCDGTCDDGVGVCCSVVDYRVCTIAGTMQGRETCTAACAWGACCGVSERCGNGEDDDCDGDTDEAGCCNEGGAEICNGQDDDCDGLCDDGFLCCENTYEPCRTSCNTIGTRHCDECEHWEPCRVPPEECNGIDDDCDGRIDEGC